VLTICSPRARFGRLPIGIRRRAAFDRNRKPFDFSRDLPQRRRKSWLHWAAPGQRIFTVGR
jgi:hypothetical protein